MARTSIPVTTLAFQGGAAISYTAADATNDMMFKNEGDMILVVKNASEAAVNVTVDSVPDEAGRTGDIALEVAAETEAVVSMLRPIWWNQRSGADIGNVYVDFDVDTSVSVAVLKIRK